MRIGTLKINKEELEYRELVKKELACLGFINIKFEWDEQASYYSVDEVWDKGYKIYASHKDLKADEIFNYLCRYNSEFNYIDFAYNKRMCAGLSDNLTRIIPSETWEEIEISFGKEKRVKCKNCHVEILNPNLKRVALCDRCFSNKKRELEDVIDLIDLEKYPEVGKEYDLLMSTKIC